jgi:hypothetical protein
MKRVERGRYAGRTCEFKDFERGRRGELKKQSRGSRVMGVEYKEENEGRRVQEGKYWEQSSEKFFT